jgi:hypothetical protein
MCLAGAILQIAPKYFGSGCKPEPAENLAFQGLFKKVQMQGAQKAEPRGV